MNWSGGCIKYGISKEQGEAQEELDQKTLVHAGYPENLSTERLSPYG